MSVLVFVELEDGAAGEASLEAITALRGLGTVDVLVCQPIHDAGSLADHGVETIHVAHFDAYAPQAWGHALARIQSEVGADVVAAAGTTRGNEVLAHAAVDLDQPFAANCLTIDGNDWSLIRVQWGGSLLEHAVLDGDPRILSIAPYAVEATPADRPGSATMAEAAVDPPPEALAVRIIDQEEAQEGVTLATARVVVSGGRGVGSAENFAMLEELADLLGGKVGCSRVVTNNGWRPHSEQIGQTGTIVAPDLYIACGISGAIQHWVGMKAAKNILAINVDGEAPMVTKADWAVVGDLHEVVPAIIEELKARRS